MKLQFVLEEEDYFQYQLFVASQSPFLKKARTRNWLISSGILFFITFILFLGKKHDATQIFLTISITVLFVYPGYQKRIYWKVFKRSVAHDYGSRFGEWGSVCFLDDHVELIDETIEAKVKLSDLVNATETSNYFYVKLRKGGHIIIPKAKLEDSISVQRELQKISNQLSIPYIEDTNWKWR